MAGIVFEEESEFIRKAIEWAAEYEFKITGQSNVSVRGESKDDWFVVDVGPDSEVVVNASQPKIIEALKKAINENPVTTVAKSKPKSVKKQYESVSTIHAVPSGTFSNSHLVNSDDLKEIHLDRSRTYKAEGGSRAATAALINRESNRYRFRTEIKEYERTEDYVRVKVRVIDPDTGQYREDADAHTKRDFRERKLTELISKHIRGTKNLISGMDATGMPIINPEVIIYDLPAPLFFAKEISKSWYFFCRHLITSCERRCQDKMLNAEWREQGELDLEKDEIESLVGGD